MSGLTDLQVIEATIAVHRHFRADALKQLTYWEAQVMDLDVELEAAVAKLDAYWESMDARREDVS